MSGHLTIIWLVTITIYHHPITSYSRVTGLPGSTPEMMFPVLYTVLVMVELRLLDKEDFILFNMSILTHNHSLVCFL